MRVKKVLLSNSCLHFSLVARSTCRGNPLNSKPLRLRDALNAVSGSLYSQRATFDFGNFIALKKKTNINEYNTVLYSQL